MVIDLAAYRNIRCAFLVVGCEEVSTAALPDVHASFQQEPNHRRVLVDNCYVEHIFPWNEQIL